MTETPLLASPAPSFAVDGTTLGALGRDTAHLEVTEGAMGLRTLVLHLVAVAPDGDGGSESWSYLDGRDVDLGSELTAVLGTGGDRRQVFRGTVSAIELTVSEGGYPYVCLRAEDALMRLRMTTRSATWEDTTDADVVRAVVDEHGLASSVDLDGPRHPQVEQQAESDLAFLRRRLERLDAELWVDADDTVHAADRASREGPTITLVQGNQLVAVTARADLAHQRSGVVVRGWDRRRVEVAEGTAGDEVVAAETTGGRTGPSLVEQVFGDVELARVLLDAGDAEHARSLATAEMLSPWPSPSVPSSRSGSRPEYPVRRG